MSSSDRCVAVLLLAAAGLLLVKYRAMSAGDSMSKAEPGISSLLRLSIPSMFLLFNYLERFFIDSVTVIINHPVLLEFGLDRLSELSAQFAVGHLHPERKEAVPDGCPFHNYLLEASSRHRRVEDFQAKHQYTGSCHSNQIDNNDCSKHRVDDNHQRRIN